MRRGADSEEKHEPASDIDIAVVDSLKVLDPERPIREADIESNFRITVKLGEILRKNIAGVFPSLKYGQVYKIWTGPKSARMPVEAMLDPLNRRSTPCAQPDMTFLG